MRSPQDCRQKTDPCASDSTGLQGLLQVPVHSHTSAATASPLPTPSSTAQAASPGALNDPISPPAPATAARNKVELLAKNYSPHVTTPINIDVLERELDGHPDRNFINSLINSLRHGTHVGYTGPHKPRVSRNLISANQHPDVVKSNLCKEISLGRVAGPFSSSPLPNLQCHPVGVVPKKHSSEWRTISHLFPKDPYALQYVKVDDAIRILKSLGPGSFMAKTDVKSAFRLIPVHPEDCHLLGIYWQQQYYVDLYLPFGLRSAPFLFNQLSDALEWVLKHNYGLQHVLHILDDFFTAEPSRLQCLSSFSKLLRFFMSVKAPVVASKTLGPSQVLEFMGIELDSTRMEAMLPEDKLQCARDLLNSFAKRRSVRLVELQSLIGILQFACKAVVPGRTFLERMINLTRGVPSRFPHIRLNKEFFRDLTMWKAFLAEWNDTTVKPSPDLELYTVASGSVGFGGYFRGQWFQGRWPSHMQLHRERGMSIEWQELFPIVVACAIWFPHFWETHSILV